MTHYQKMDIFQTFSSPSIQAMYTGFSSITSCPVANDYDIARNESWRRIFGVKNQASFG